MRIRWARSATKHRVSRERSRYVIEHCRAPFVEIQAGVDPRLIFLGDDAAGVALEVMAVLGEHEGLLVIHAMPLRERYRPRYEEVRKWQESR